WQLLVRRRAALGVLGYSVCFAMANDTLFVVYGAWLERDFHLPLAQLGTATIAIGAAELVAEILTALLADRIGLARAAVGGVAVTVAAYLLLPAAAQGLPLALCALFVVFLAFEFTVVTAVGLITEVLPDARGTMMGMPSATSVIGRMPATLTVGSVWPWCGHAAPSTTDGALALV